MEADIQSPDTLFLLTQILPVFVKLVSCYIGLHDPAATKDAHNHPETAKLTTTDYGGISNGRYRLLCSKFCRLNYTLEEYDHKVPVTTEGHEAVYQLADILDRLVSAKAVERGLKKAGFQDPKGSIISERSETDIGEDVEYPNLLKLFKYKRCVPEKDQKIIKNFSALEKKKLERNVVQLSLQVDTCERLLGRQNNQTSSPRDRSNQAKKRFAQSNFRKEKSARQICHELHGLLCQNWPCKCGQDHNEKIGNCSNVKLRLRPDWMLHGACPSDFDIIFHDEGISPQDCNIKINTGQSSSCETTEKNQSPCQILLNSAEGMQLRIVASEVDGQPKFSTETPSPTFLAPWSPGASMTLQELIDGSVVLKRRERRILGVILASSFLHLLDSLWMQHSWNSEDISFYYGSEGNHNFANFRRPYLSTSLKSSDRGERSGEAAHPMSGMVTLGRVLLDLECKDTSLSFTISQDSASPYIQAKLLLEGLREWAQDLQDMDDFIESITKCLDMTTYTATSFQNKDLMWNVYNIVIFPLERELLRICGSSSIAEGSLATLDDLEALLMGIASEAPARVNAQVGVTQSLRTTPPAQPGQFHYSDIEGDSSTCWSDMWFDKLRETEKFMDVGRKKTRNLEGVTIAVLDTGIDLTHPFLRGRIAEGDCWDFVTNSPDICDEVGHGTHTTSLLLKTATTARVFGGRVFRTRKADNGTCQRIVKAIRHAVDVWKVQIINMSFTFYEIDQGVREALRYTTSKRVLLFAAASNDRLLERNPIGFPASEANVFCIFSERRPACRSNFSPEGEEKQKNFSLIGENVKGAWPLQRNEMQETKRDSGTSCATPIAAGIAALILEYTKHSGSKKVEDPDALGDRAVMERVMFECMTGKNQGQAYNLVKPWIFFHSEADRARVSGKISDLIANY